jgi:hypothetical protein
METPGSKSEVSWTWPKVTTADFLGALDAAAEAADCRAVLAIDALNERHGIALWESRLPGFIRLVQKFPRLALVLTVRSTYFRFLPTERPGARCSPRLRRPRRRRSKGLPRPTWHRATQLSEPGEGVREPAVPSNLLRVPRHRGPQAASQGHGRRHSHLRLLPNGGWRTRSRGS